MTDCKLGKLDFYCFSHTGGTKKAGRILAETLAENVILHSWMRKDADISGEDSGLALFAVPVFAGRIPAFCAEKIRHLDGHGRKAATLAVYGVRAYDDALLELNQAVKAAGFQVIASGAFIAQHSMVPAVGAGRPDDKDAAELKEFGQKILCKLNSGNVNEPEVPGKFPYKPDFTVQATPFSANICTLCGKCAKICPADAVSIHGGAVSTDKNKCLLCMACVHSCPAKCRLLPPPMQKALTQKLIVFKDIRRENLVFL